jgi:1-acyl-sn-glycerol-3-phosphate acyltransferase
LLYWIGWSLSLIISKAFGRLKVTGRENVPKTGPVILAPNHVSYADPPVVGAGVYRPVRFMAKKELFEIPVLGKLIAGVGAFPVRQHTADRAALKRALELLAKGEVVCIFPEGQRSPDGELMEAQSGLGMIALKSKAPVVPVALIGTDKMLRPHSPLLHFAKVRTIYGKPMTFDEFYDKGMDREAIDEVGKRVMAAIAKLKQV